MNRNNNKALIRKYKLYTFGIFGIFIALAILALIYTDSVFLYSLLLILAVLAYKITGVILYNVLFNSILSRDLNLPQYKTLVESGKIISASLIENVYVAYYSGDYNKAIQICKMKLESPKNKHVKHFYLLMLARSYFETGDLDKLEQVNQAFKSFIASAKKGNKLQKKLHYFKFVDFYLNKNFSAAKDYYETLYQQRKQASDKNRLANVSIAFTLAVCRYKCGEYPQATELFEKIIATAPTFHYAELSKGYLQAMEKNADYIPPATSSDFGIVNLPQPKSNAKAKVLYILAFSLILLSLILSAILPLFRSKTDLKQPIHFEGLDYYSTQDDIRALYGEPQEETKDFDLYSVDYLGIDATIHFIYFEDDSLYKARYLIDSTKFANAAEYELAVQTTYNHFADILSEYKIEDEDTFITTWHDEKNVLSYCTFEADITFVEENNDVRKCTVFEFSKKYK